MALNFSTTIIVEVQPPNFKISFANLCLDATAVNQIIFFQKSIIHAEVRLNYFFSMIGAKSIKLFNTKRLNISQSVKIDIFYFCFLIDGSLNAGLQKRLELRELQFNDNGSSKLF